MDSSECTTTRPSRLSNALRLPKGVADTIQFSSSVKVKDYPPQPVANQDARQISVLTQDEIRCLSDELSDHQDVLDFFGYELLRDGRI